MLPSNFLSLLVILVGICSNDKFKVSAEDIILYKFDPELDKNGGDITQRLLSQMRVVESSSCFRFVEDNNATSGYVSFDRGILGGECVPGWVSTDPIKDVIHITVVPRPCRRLGNQEPGAYNTVYLRAVMYSLGFVDEILREDRDAHVKFIPACTPDEYMNDEYKTKPANEIPFQAPGVSPYDMNSVMQRDTVFMDGCPMFLDNNLEAIRGEADRGLSHIDKERLKAMCLED